MADMAGMPDADEQITTLSADCLWSKFGFGDGAPFRSTTASHDDLAEAMGDVEACDILIVLVRRYLIPEIARVTGATPETRIIHGHHNPIRIVGYETGTPPEGWEDIEVGITLEDIRSAAAEVRSQSTKPN